MVCLELYKAVQPGPKGKPVEAYRNTFANLALPLFAMAEPIPPKVTKYNGLEFSLWDRWTLEGDLTVREVSSRAKAHPEVCTGCSGCPRVGGVLRCTLTGGSVRGWPRVMAEPTVSRAVGHVVCGPDWVTCDSVQVLDWFEAKGLNAYSISCGPALLYNNIFPKHAERMNKKMSELVVTVAKVRCAQGLTSCGHRAASHGFQPVWARKLHTCRLPRRPCMQCSLRTLFIWQILTLSRSFGGCHVRRRWSCPRTATTSTWWWRARTRTTRTWTCRWCPSSGGSGAEEQRGANGGGVAGVGVGRGGVGSAADGAVRWLLDRLRLTHVCRWCRMTGKGSRLMATAARASTCTDVRIQLS